MAARGSKISRVREYFRTGDIDEVEVVLQLINKDVASRQQSDRQPALPFTGGKTRKRRAKKSNAEPAERHTDAREAINAPATEATAQ